jgi:hypothetical protein
VRSDWWDQHDPTPLRRNRHLPGRSESVARHASRNPAAQLEQEMVLPLSIGQAAAGWDASTRDVYLCELSAGESRRMTAHRYACHNRAPYEPDMRVQDGWIAARITRDPVMVSVPFTLSRECQFTHSDLGRSDSQCQGCKWRAENLYANSASAAKIDEPAKCVQHDAGSNQSAKEPHHG